LNPGGLAFSLQGSPDCRSLLPFFLITFYLREQGYLKGVILLLLRANFPGYHVIYGGAGFCGKDLACPPKKRR